MGFLGNLLGGKVEVEGRIAVQNRPAETYFLHSVFFVPSEANAPPPMPGLPDEAVFMQWPAAERLKLEQRGLGDIGEAFSARLSPGHYQVLVTSTPFVIEGGKLVPEPNNRFGFWPQRQAVSLQAGNKRTLSLRLAFPAGLGRFGERQPGLPLTHRIGPTLAARFANVAQLGNQNDHAGALRGYQMLLASPELSSLVPADGNELRLVLEMGRVKCLLGLKRVEEAAQLVGSTMQTTLPKVRLSEGDPMTAFDFMTTVALVGALSGRHNGLQDMAADAVATLEPFIAQPGPQRDAGFRLGDGFFAQLGRALRSTRATDAAVNVFDAIISRLQPLAGAEQLTTSAKLEFTEALALAGREAEAEAQVSDLNGEAVATLLPIVEQRGLNAVHALLSRRSQRH